MSLVRSGLILTSGRCHWPGLDWYSHQEGVHWPGWTNTQIRKVSTGQAGLILISGRCPLARLDWYSHQESVHWSGWTDTHIRKVSTAQAGLILTSGRCHWSGWINTHIRKVSTLILRRPSTEDRWGSYDCRWVKPIQDNSFLFHEMGAWKWESRQAALSTFCCWEKFQV